MIQTQEQYDIHANHPVIKLIQERQATSSKTGRLALVVEGGGQKGAVTGSMLTELERHGIGPDIFDMLIGTSAGAFNIAYYLAGQVEQGIKIYTEQLIDLDFVNFYRWLYGKPIMNHDISVDHIMDTAVPIQWEKIIQSKKFYAVASDPTSTHQSSVILGPPKSVTELKQFLRATAHIPIIAGKPPKINGSCLYDGGMTAMLPVDQAIELGATHVLALSARNLENWKSEITKLEQFLLQCANTKWPGIPDVLHHRVRKNAIQSKQYIHARANPEQPPYVLVIDCPDLGKISRFETNKKHIHCAVTAGSSAIQAVLK